MSAQSEEILMDTALPNITTEIHRYVNPDRYGFHYLEPDETGNWNIFPFLAEERGPRYKTTIPPQLKGWADAKQERKRLLKEGYEPFHMSALPESLQNYVINNEAPMEWHSDLNRRMQSGWASEFNYITVWVKGDLPS